MNWGAALAQGFGNVAGQYNANQQQQRQFNMQQKEADADLLRKKNFARFNVDLNTGALKEKSKIDVETYKGKSEIDEGNKASIYVDENGRPLTKAEIAKRPEGVKGLEKASDYNANQKTQQKIKGKDAEVEAALKRLKETHPEGTEAYKRGRDKILGVPEKKDYTQKNDAAAKKEFLKDVNKFVLEDGGDPDVARAKYLKSATIKPGVLKATGDARLMFASAVPAIASQLQGNNVNEKVVREQLKDGISGKSGKKQKLSDSQIDIIVKYMDDQVMFDKLGFWR